MKFRSYSYSQKSVDKFLNRISEVFGDNIIIGYGNWSINRTSQMKYYESTMNVGLRRLIHKRYDTITINEHCTSKKCCECHNDLCHHKDKNNKEIFRLLKCSNCVSSENKRIVFRTRDVNSAVNIMDITRLWIEEQRRLPVFCRSDKSSFTTSVIEVEKVGPSLPLVA
jgi:phosphosulfolactate synthase (CoM biosynthesis protein A)